MQSCLDFQGVHQCFKYCSLFLLWPVYIQKHKTAHVRLRVGLQATRYMEVHLRDGVLSLVPMEFQSLAIQ